MSVYTCIWCLISHIALCPGSNYAGEGKRAWYLPFAVTKKFLGIPRKFDTIVTLSTMCRVTQTSYLCMLVLAQYKCVYILHIFSCLEVKLYIRHYPTSLR